jgi:hypothetical protein
MLVSSVFTNIHAKSPLILTEINNFKPNFNAFLASNVARNRKICNLCDINEIGDEFHYILECNYLNNVRENILTPITEIN